MIGVVVDMLLNILPEWPFGVTQDLARIDLTADTLATRFKVVFQRDEDDLDKYSYLPLKIGSDSFVLQAHDRDPSQSTVILCAPASGAILARRLRLIEQELGLEKPEIGWRSPLIRRVPGVRNEHRPRREKTPMPMRHVAARS